MIDGEVKVNGQIADWDKITRYSGYVQQEEIFIGTMTVREHLTFVVIILIKNYLFFKIKTYFVRTSKLKPFYS